MNKYDMVTVLGPTACGKTSRAVGLAYNLNSEIISADSRQIYRGMDLGTGKDLCEYTLNGRKIPYHLIDIVESGYKYNVFEYQRDFLNSYNDIVSRGIMPVLCGGTGMYIEAILKGYKLLPVPENKELRSELEKKSLTELTNILSTYKRMHNTTDVDTVKRAVRAIEIEEYYKSQPPEYMRFPTIRSLIVGIDIDRDSRRQRITQRLRQRLEDGMVDEVKSLLRSGIAPEDLIYYGLEYKYLTLYVIGEITYEQMFSQLEVAIHQFAKRQMTWFRGMERRGLKINWLEAGMPMDEKIDAIKEMLEKI